MNGKQKNIALLIGFIVMLFISYQLSFKKTLDLRKTQERLSKELSLLDNANDQMINLQVQNKQLEKVLLSNNVSLNQSFEQALFEKITDLSKKHRLQIVSFDKPHEYESDGANLLSYTIEVQGDFRNLMLFSSELEQMRMGKLASTSFLKKRNYRTQRNELNCKIILQRLSK